LIIGDEEIDDLLRENQHSTVRQNLQIIQAKKKLEDTKVLEEVKRKTMDEKAQTAEKEQEQQETLIDQANTLAMKRLTNDKNKQKDLDEISNANLERRKKAEKQQIEFKRANSEIRVEEFEKEMKAIQPKLIEALISSNDVQFSAILARNLKEQRGGLAGLFENKGGWQAILAAVEGSPLEKRIKKLANDYSTLYNEDTDEVIDDNENEE